MNRPSTIVLLAGFVIGLLAGMILVSASGDLSDSLFGTAGDGKKPKDPLAYFQVPLADIEEWLVETYPDTSEDLKLTVDAMSKFVDDAALFDRDFALVEEDISYLLPYVYGALTGLEEEDLAEPENLKIDKESKLSVCLALDDDPYMGATMYLYVTLPKDMLEDIEIPKEWEQLKDAKTNVIYWTLLGCLPELEKQTKIRAEIEK